ncbi:UNVERIFIED_CONTAM: hypothetical protein Sradi_3158200 [Sesamum radiatum]|uniref:Uncharacterized protein n=1 Tax=Sesamum radiatum TaxID=300843 RepID=A0AAW2RED0_SESRA
MRGCLPGSGLICEGRLPGSRLIFYRGCPPEEVFDEVLWRGGPVNRSGRSWDDSPTGWGQGCPWYDLQSLGSTAVSTALSLFSALLGDFIVIHVFNFLFPQTAPIDACEKCTGPMSLDDCSRLRPE